MMLTRTPLIGAALAAPLLVGCAKQSADRSLVEEKPIPVVDAEPTYEKDRVVSKVGDNVDVVETALAYAGASEFVEALREAGLEDELRRADMLYTVFVPSNEAFDRARLGDDKAELARLMRYYIVPGRLTSYELTTLAATPTTSGQEIDVTVDPDGAFFAVNQARVVKPNVEATNGIIHVVDDMLLPPDHPAAAALRDEARIGTLDVERSIAEACGIKRPRAFFALNSAEIRVSAVDPLAELATCVTTGPLAGEILRIEGFADPRGESSYNKTLAAQRAAAIADYLQAKGVADTQLLMVSHGETRAHDEQPRFWDYDRRVEVSRASREPPKTMPILVTPPAEPEAKGTKAPKGTKESEKSDKSAKVPAPGEPTATTGIPVPNE